MSKGYKCVINAVIYAVALNLILPLIAVRFATDVEKKPPGCPSKLPFKSQVMHMLYHHSKVYLDEQDLCHDLCIPSFLHVYIP